MGESKVRKRVAQACHRCRQRKFKCDGRKPECSTCVQSSQPCLYDSHIKRRGLPEGYVRGLELLASLAIRHIDKFEERLLFQLQQKNKDHRFEFEWHSDFEDLLDGWRNSKLAFELENILPSLPSPKSHSVKRKFEDTHMQSTATGPRRFWSHTSTTQSNPLGEFFLHADEHLKPLPEIDNSQNLQVEDNLLQPPALESEMGTFISPNHPPEPASNNVTLPTQVGGLVKLYFHQTHCWLPIVNKTEVMRSSYHYANAEPSVDSKSGSFSLLWAITASTSSQLLKSGRLAEFLQTDTVSDALVSSYYTKARDSIPSEEGPFEIDHVQALLILSLMKIEESSWSAAWMLVGKALRIITDLLNTPSSLAQHKKTFLACFVLDTLLAFSLSRPPHLRIEDADKVGSIDEDGLDEWDLWSNPFDATHSSQSQSVPLFTLSTFNRLVQTCKIMQGVLLSRLYSKHLLCEDPWKNLPGTGRQPIFDNIFKQPTAIAACAPENNMLPHHYHLRIIYLAATIELMPHSDSTTDDYTIRRSICIAEIESLIKSLGEKFGLHSIPPTCSLLKAILSSSESQSHPSTDNGSQQPIKAGATQETLELPTQGQNEGATAYVDDTLADSNSVFNDFVAIDTSQWTSNWEEGLFNLGFSADASTNDFYEFCEPNP